jgi:hypothetical protein
MAGADVGEHPRSFVEKRGLAGHDDQQDKSWTITEGVCSVAVCWYARSTTSTRGTKWVVRGMTTETAPAHAYEME